MAQQMNYEDQDVVWQYLRDMTLELKKMQQRIERLEERMR